MNVADCMLRKASTPVPFTDDFKQRLNKALVSSGLTRIALAKACGVGASTVTRWLDEESKVMPELKKLGDICRTLNVSASYLIEGDGAPLSEGPNVALAREIATKTLNMTEQVVALLSPGDPSPSRRGKAGRKPPSGGGGGINGDR